MNLADLLPEYYNGVYEVQELIKSENNEFNKFDDTTQRALLNQFVMLANSDGLDSLESQFGITVSSSESIENRRYTLLTRLLPPKPITRRYFEELMASLNIPLSTKIDAIKQSFIAVVNSDNVSSNQIEQLENLINVYLPANLVTQIMKIKYGDTEMERYIGTANQLKIKGVSYCHDQL